MSSATTKPVPSSKPGQGSLPSTLASKGLLKLNHGRSTPDSEALASSDDENESHRQEPPSQIGQPPKPVRRASWLNDTSPVVSQPSGLPRKGSFASTSMSPTTSHPTTPSADAGVWGPHSATNVMSRHGTGSFSSWGAQIWNTERKEPPSRLTEVLPCPTSTMPPSAAASGIFSSEAGPTQPSPAPRESGPNSQIPFPIPLYPTPKTYRSQSYSVGQLEPETPNPLTSALHGTGRRPIPHSGLQHRPSRPSMLSEMSNELQKVKEVEDDEEEEASSVPPPQPQPQQQAATEAAKQIEYLTRENAMLRQQQYQNRIRPRASSSYMLGNGYSTVPEESDYAIEELDESREGAEIAAARRATLTRRMSEFGSGAGQLRAPYALENRKLENVKKAAWQSSLGFAGLGDIPQSRRHSFADVPIPTRQGSISSMSDAALASEQNTLIQEPQQMADYSTGYGETSHYPLGATG